MVWRMVEIPDKEALATDLTDSEFVGISVLLINCCGEPMNDWNVYYRAWEKIQPQVTIANEKGDDFI